MVLIGNFNTLTIVKRVPFGYYLDGHELGEILLPLRYTKGSMAINTTIDVFIYKDSEDRLIATTEQPLAQVGEFAFLQFVGLLEDRGRQAREQFLVGEGVLLTRRFEFRIGDAGERQRR